MLKTKSFHLSEEQYLKLAKGSHLAAFIGFIPLMLAFIYLSVFVYDFKSYWAIPVFVIGFYTWGFFEYVLHRFSFHFHWNFGEIVRFFTSGFHTVHHHHPQSKEFIVAPIYMAYWGMFWAMLLFWLVTQNWGHAYMLSGGMSLGYMYYEWIHYISHHKNLKTRYYKRLKDHHLFHHFKNDKANFGVSYFFWDHVFRTYSKGFDKQY